MTSYDYDSPIDEAGRLAPKFALYRDVIRKHLAPGETLPEPPPPLPMIEIPRFDLGRLRRSDAARATSGASPEAFEELGQAYGFVLYRTQMAKAGRRKIEITELRDYAVIMQNGRGLGTSTGSKAESTLEVALEAGKPLDILVENMGRINFGPKLLEDRKGITSKVTVDGEEITGWEMFGLPLENLRGLKFSTQPASGPAFYRGSFELRELGDTYFDMRGWGKGYVWVNGVNLGRHWKVGPQQTLFCPGVWLRQGTNEIVVLDLYDGSPTRSVAGVTNPVWETHG